MSVIQIKTFFVWVTVLITMITGRSFAFEASTDCLNPIKKKSFFSSFDLQNIFSNYTNNYSKKLDDGTYVLCFEMNNPIIYDKNRPIEVFTSIEAPLLIYGLNIDASKLDALSLFKLSGTNIIFRDSILKGPKQPYMLLDVTAIEILTGSGNITIGPNMNIGAFDIGVSIDSGAFALVTQTQTSGDVHYPVFRKPPALLPDSTVDGELISEEWIGKNITESDGYKIDSIAGKVFIDESKGDKCSGEVELYTSSSALSYQEYQKGGYEEYKKWFDKNKLILFVERYYYATCQVSKVEGKDVIIRSEKDCEDGQYETKILPVDTCYFDCKNLNTVSDAFSSKGFLFNGCLGNTADGGITLADCDPASWYIPQTLQFLPAYLYYGPCVYPMSTGLGGIAMPPVDTEMDEEIVKPTAAEKPIIIAQEDLPPQDAGTNAGNIQEGAEQKICLDPPDCTKYQISEDNKDDSKDGSGGTTAVQTGDGSEVIGQGSGCSCTICVRNF